MAEIMKKSGQWSEVLNIVLFFKALRNKKIDLWYQPQYDLATKEIVGFEALLRWKIADNEYVPPLELISFAEKNGLITNLDIYVVEKFCEDFKSLLLVPRVNKEKLRVAINISGTSFKNREIMRYIEYLIQKNNISSMNLEFELTETSVINDKDIYSISETVFELRKKGYSVALDDFGTGYSNLALLSQVSVDVLKIDKSFLQGTEKTNKILDGILFLTKSLNLKTIGEGIETQEQEEFLINKGCDIGQGYLFSKPLPLNNLLCNS